MMDRRKSTKDVNKMCCVIFCIYSPKILFKATFDMLNFKLKSELHIFFRSFIKQACYVTFL